MSLGIALYIAFKEIKSFPLSQVKHFGELKILQSHFSQNQFSVGFLSGFRPFISLTARGYYSCRTAICFCLLKLQPKKCLQSVYVNTPKDITHKILEIQLFSYYESMKVSL